MKRTEQQRAERKAAKKRAAEELRAEGGSWGRMESRVQVSRPGIAKAIMATPKHQRRANAGRQNIGDFTTQIDQ